MNRDELLQQIKEWREKEESQKIIDAIEALPREEWDYELTGLLVHAYNNLAIMGEGLTLDEEDRLLERAVSLLEIEREAGKEDAGWHFCMGYALYYLERTTEAMACLRRAAELDPNNEGIQHFIQECEEYLASEEERNSEYGEVELTQQDGKAMR